MTSGRRWTPLALILAAAALLTAGCDPEQGPGPSGSNGTTPSPAIARGGSATFGVYGEPATLDPYSPLASDLTYALARPLYRSLYRFTPEGEAAPDLVRRLKAAGEIVTIDLARARWSDGRPITSRDVAATIRRARPPSGLASIDSVTPRGPRRLVLSGAVVDWPEALARVSYVLPARVGAEVYSGPFILRSRVPGLQLLLTPNPASDVQPYLDRVTIRFTEGLDFLIGLLSDGRLDAAWLPSSVNLAQRLDELGLEHDRVLGWERIYLDLAGADLPDEERRRVARAIDRSQILNGFVRADGRIANTLHPAPGERGAEGAFGAIFRGRDDRGSADLQLSAPIGDELLELVQRLVQVQLDSAGFEVELVNVDARRFYGEWAADDPIAGALRRAGGAPGWEEPERGDLDRLPLFQVSSYIVRRAGMEGLKVNATIEGPLWNAETWHLSSQP